MKRQHQPRKRFGQHFLRSPQVLTQITQAIQPCSDEHFVEIGAGEGMLTQYLLPYCGRLDAIEIDNDLIPVLEARFANINHFFLHHQDVLQLNFAALPVMPKKLRIVGNLPYNISSPLLFNLFTQLDVINDMHFMLQKEVAQRMSATVGSQNYNRLSVMTQYFCNNTILFDVDRSAFAPPPNVESSVVRMLPYQIQPAAKNLDVFAQLVKTAFTYRRKTLRNCLKGLVDCQSLERLGIDPSCRPQQLSVHDFVKIANHRQII